MFTSIPGGCHSGTTATITNNTHSTAHGKIEDNLWLIIICLGVGFTAVVLNQMIFALGHLHVIGRFTYFHISRNQNSSISKRLL